MDLKQLTYFVTVAEELNFGRAAERLNMTQPPLSIQIKNLEQDLGVKLFERGRNKAVTLTPSGTTFLAEARKTIAQANRARQAARNAHEGQTGHIVFGYTDDFLNSPLPDLLAGILGDGSGFSIEHAQGLSFALVEQLEKGELDAAFINLPQLVQEKKIGILPLMTTRPVIVVSANHPVAQKKSVRLAELVEEQFHTLPEFSKSGFSLLESTLFSHAGFSPRSIEGSYSSILSLILISRGIGIALMPQSGVPPFIPGIQVLELEGHEAELELALAWRKDRRSPHLDRFIHLASQTFTNNNAQQASKARVCQ